MKNDLALLKKTLQALSGSNQKCKAIMGALWRLRSTGTLTPAVSELTREFKAAADAMAGQAVFLRDASETLLLALIGQENGELPANKAGNEEGDERAVMPESQNH